MTRLGFTGTGDSFTREHGRFVLALLRGTPEFHSIKQFHHGDCIEADAAVERLAREVMGWRTYAHPPVDTKARAWTPSNVILPTAGYMVRNHDIVDATQALLAAPLTPEIIRSGTWATVRYARKIGRPIIIVYADGRVDRERC